MINNRQVREVEDLPSASGERHMEHIRLIRIDQIDFAPQPWRPINYRRDRRWAEFVTSVREHGLLIEPKCRMTSAGTYEPITAFQALLAAREAGAEDVRCVVSDLDDVAATVSAFHARLADAEPAGLVLEQAWSVENLRRELVARGEAASCRAIAARIGRSKSFASYSLNIAKALPRDRLLAIAAEEGISEAVAVTLPKAAAAGLANLDNDNREAVLRSALRAIPRKGGAATVVAQCASKQAETLLLRLLKRFVYALRHLLRQVLR